MELTEHFGNTANGEALIYKVNIKRLEMHGDLKISLDSILNCLISNKCILIQGILKSIYTSDSGAIFKDKLFLMFGASVATGTIMTSQVNVVASPYRQVRLNARWLSRR